MRNPDFIHLKIPSKIKSNSDSCSQKMGASCAKVLKRNAKRRFKPVCFNSDCFQPFLKNHTARTVQVFAGESWEDKTFTFLVLPPGDMISLRSVLDKRSLFRSAESLGRIGECYDITVFVVDAETFSFLGMMRTNDLGKEWVLEEEDIKMFNSVVRIQRAVRTRIEHRRLGAVKVLKRFYQAIHRFRVKAAVVIQAFARVLICKRKIHCCKCGSHFPNGWKLAKFSKASCGHPVCVSCLYGLCESPRARCIVCKGDYDLPSLYRIMNIDAYDTYLKLNTNAFNAEIMCLAALSPEQPLPFARITQAQTWLKHTAPFNIHTVPGTCGNSKQGDDTDIVINYTARRLRLTLGNSCHILKQQKYLKLRHARNNCKQSRYVPYYISIDEESCVQSLSRQFPHGSRHTIHPPGSHTTLVLDALAIRCAIFLQSHVRRYLHGRYSQCDICMGQLPISLMVLSSRQCRHFYCQGCLENYTRHALEDGRIVITCPEPTCKTVLDDEDLYKFVPEDVVHNRYEFVEKRHRSYLESLLNGEGVDKKFMKWAKSNTRVCPSCKVLIYRCSGCAHMVCVCGNDFDWFHDKDAQISFYASNLGGTRPKTNWEFLDEVADSQIQLSGH
mmetsp:Transcript_36870/g.59787  ORF Transcript_36870/g.59787 Transcript_36870/m.59787 type:complete len:614 (-) Transcript_36870:567-2408(-)